jgi:ribosomal protein L19E
VLLSNRISVVSVHQISVPCLGLVSSDKHTALIIMDDSKPRAKMGNYYLGKTPWREFDFENIPRAELGRLRLPVDEEDEEDLNSRTTTCFAVSLAQTNSSTIQSTSRASVHAANVAPGRYSHGSRAGKGRKTGHPQVTQTDEELRKEIRALRQENQQLKASRNSDTTTDISSITSGHDFGESVDQQALFDSLGEGGIYSGSVARVARSTFVPHGWGRMRYNEVGRIYHGDWYVFVL